MPSRVGTAARRNRPYARRRRLELKGVNGRRIMRVPPRGMVPEVGPDERRARDGYAVELKSGENVGGVEFTLTQRASTITGRVQDAEGQAMSDYVLVAFTSDARGWGIQTRFIRTARPDPSGTFKLTGPPPEDCLLAALAYLEPEEKATRNRSSGWAATPVTIAEDASRHVRLETDPMTDLLTR